MLTSQLQKVGVKVKIEQIEWGQWLSRVWKDADYDLTIIGHAEAWDVANYANPKYYFRYDSPKVIGVLGGYVGGWVDEVVMRFVDAVQGFPAILSALLFAAAFAPGLVVGMTAIGIAFVPAFARLTRSGFLEFREREFVLAARALGAGDVRLVGRHILPNTVPPLIIQAPPRFPWPSWRRRALPTWGSGPSRHTRRGA